MKMGNQKEVAAENRMASTSFHMGTHPVHIISRLKITILKFNLGMKIVFAITIDHRFDSLKSN